jgi:hypothetical protein
VADNTDRCVICDYPLVGTRMGAGDGSGQKFAHPSCYWQREAKTVAGEVEAWRERFRALVGEDQPDAAGNAVIHIQRDVEFFKGQANDYAAQARQLEDRAVASEQRGAALHRTDRPQLRDEFAAAALTGLLGHDDDETMARRAYEIADAMLARRVVVKP